MAGLFWIGLGVSLVYVLAKAIYRLYFHPLSRFPGPKLTAVSYLYEFYFSVVKDGLFLWEIEKMHQQYGPIVRINPDEIHIRDPYFYKEIYSSGPKRREKATWFHRSAFGIHGLPTIVDHDHHHHRRKLLQPHFSPAAVAKIEPMIQEKTDIFLARLANTKKTHRPVCLDGEIFALAVSITTAYLLRTDMTSKHLELVHRFYESHHEGAWLSSLVSFIPLNFMSLMRRLPLWVLRTFRPGIAAVMELDRAVRLEIELFTAQVQKEPGDRILDTLSRPGIPADERTVDQLLDESLSTVIGGTESISTTVSRTMFHVLDDRELCFELRNEIMSSVPSFSSTASVNQLQSLPLLRAIVHEGLRLSFFTLANLPRVAPDEIIRYQEWAIPPGTPVSSNVYFTHMDPDLFPDPTSFKPRRWMLPLEERRALENMLVSFSKGSRQCIAINLAYAELYLLIATLVCRIDLELVDTTLEHVTPYRAHILSLPKNGYHGVLVRVAESL